MLNQYHYWSKSTLQICIAQNLEIYIRLFLQVILCFRIGLKDVQKKSHFLKYRLYIRRKLKVKNKSYDYLYIIWDNLQTDIFWSKCLTIEFNRALNSTLFTSCKIIKLIYCWTKNMHLRTCKRLFEWLFI